MYKWFVKNLKKDNKGFTLIELVVVIAILGILAGIAVPKYTSSRLNAAIIAHNANVRTLESAANMYIADGKLTEAITNDEGTKLSGYIQEWPTVPNGIKSKDGNTDYSGKNYQVSITKDGEITVTPSKAGEDGKLLK